MQEGLETGAFSFGRRNNRHEHENDVKALFALMEPTNKRLHKTESFVINNEEEKKTEEKKANEGNACPAKGFYGRKH